MSNDSNHERSRRRTAAKLRSIYAYLRGIQPHYKARIGRVFRKRLSEAGVGRVSGGRFPCNRKTREIVADSIFAVEDELESRRGGQPWHPDVLAMNSARNRVYTDLGWNGEVHHP